MDENADMRTLKLANYRRIWNFVHVKGTVTIPEISKNVGLSLPTVTRAVEFSLKEGLMRQAGIVLGERGRRACRYRLNADYIHFIFISIRRGFLDFEVHDFLSNVLKKSSVPFKDGTGFSSLNSIVKKCLEEDPLIRMAGVAFSGAVNNGVIDTSFEFPSFSGFDLKRHLNVKFGLVAFVENDLKVAVSAAASYSQKAESGITIAFLFGSDGYGSGVLVDGKLLKGAHGSTGRLSNLVVTQKDRRSNKIFSEFLRSLCAVFDPDRVVLYPGENADAEKVKARAFKEFKNQKTPEFIEGRSFQADIFLGLKTICKKELLESSEKQSVLGLKIE